MNSSIVNSPATDTAVIKALYCCVGTGFLFFTIFMISVFSKYYPSSSIFQVFKTCIYGSKKEYKELDYFKIKLLLVVIVIRLIYFGFMKITAFWVFHVVLTYVSIISLFLNGIVFRVLFELCLMEINVIKLAQISKNFLKIVLNYWSLGRSVLFSMFPIIRGAERISEYGYSSSEIRTKKNIINVKSTLNFYEHRNFVSSANYLYKEKPFYKKSANLRDTLLSIKDYEIFSNSMIVNYEKIPMIFPQISKNFYKFYPKFEITANYSYLIFNDKQKLWMTDIASIDYCVRKQRGIPAVSRSLDLEVSPKERIQVFEFVNNFAKMIDRSNGNPKNFQRFLLEDSNVQNFQKHSNPNWIDGLRNFTETQFVQLESKNIATGAFSGQEVVYPMDTELRESLEEFRRSQSEVLFPRLKFKFSTAIGIAFLLVREMGQRHYGILKIGIMNLFLILNIVSMMQC